MAERATKQKLYTPEQYLAKEEKAEFRSEFVDGNIVAMAGGTLDHAQVTINVAKTLDNRIGENCRVLTTDVKVQVESYRRFYYPDILVICGEPIFYPKRNDTIVNPVLIVEVLSKKTEAQDRGEKFAAYQSLESLQEYVLVSPDKAVVEQFSRQNDGSWKYQATIGLKSTVIFESIDVELTLDEIYQRVKL